MKKELEDLYHEIEHGDKEHKQWLWDKMEEFSKKNTNKLFGDRPEERAMTRLIHDTNGAFAILGYWTNKLKTLVSSEQTELSECIKYIDSSKKELKGAIDLYYTRFSNDFKPL